MAKKDPTDLTVEEKLKALYQLQTTLSAIDEKRDKLISMSDDHHNLMD